MRLVIVGGMLALAVSVSLTAANGAADKYGTERQGAKTKSCFGVLRCNCRVQCGDIPVGKPSPAIAACMEKCVKAKEAAQR
jgi:hypothetical protein